MDLEKRWSGTARAVPALEGTGTGGGGGGGGGVDVGAATVEGVGVGAGTVGRLSQAGAGAGVGDVWEPRVMRISGHADRYLHPFIPFFMTPEIDY
jgi:hypothetical protein